MKKLNWECFAQITILLILDGLLFVTLITDRMKYYVHPRIEKYVWLAVAALVLIVLSLLPMLFKPKHKINLLPCIILLVPIMSGFTLDYSAPTGTVGIQSISSSPVQDNQAAEQEQVVSEISGNDTLQSDDTGLGEYEDSQSDPAALTDDDTGLGTFNAEGDFITVSDDDYARWYMDAYENPKKYEGKTIKLKGLVFRGEGFGTDEFVPARMYMACCAADLSPVGFMCKSSEAGKFKNNEWVYVTAKIKVEYEKNMNATVPVLYAQTIAPAEKPQEELIYLY